MKTWQYMRKYYDRKDTGVNCGTLDCAECPIRPIMDLVPQPHYLESEKIGIRSRCRAALDWHFEHNVADKLDLI
jgi:hypothetical protein